MFAEYVQQSAAGDLWVDTTVATEARDATEEWLSKLEVMHSLSLQIPMSAGFSDFNSAQQLAAKFDRKVTDAKSGLQERLAQFIQVGQELSDLFLHSIQKFSDTDEAAAAYLEKNHLPKELPNPAGG